MMYRRLATVCLIMLATVGTAQDAPQQSLQQQLQRLQQATQRTTTARQQAVQQEQAGSRFPLRGAAPVASVLPTAPKGFTKEQQAQATAAAKQPTAVSPDQVALTPAQVAATQAKDKRPATRGAAQATTAAAAPKTNIQDQAFLNMTNAVLPLAPRQIRLLRALFNHTQQAAAQYPGVPPRPTSSSIMVNLAPAATPPVIRLRVGYVSSLVFIDSTGAPWPIKSYDIGDPKAYNVQWNKTGNVLLVQALTSYKAGNLAVMLKGLNTPVMVTLMAGQRAVDYRADLRVPGLGPNAHSAGNGLPGAASPLLLAVLDGIPPHGSKTLAIEGCPDPQCQLWAYKGNFYLRSQYTLLSPGWVAAMSSPRPDEIHAYQLKPAPILYMSVAGKPVWMKVTGW